MANSKPKRRARVVVELTLPECKALAIASPWVPTKTFDRATSKLWRAIRLFSTNERTKRALRGARGTK